MSVERLEERNGVTRMDMSTVVNDLPEKEAQHEEDLQQWAGQDVNRNYQTAREVTAKRLAADEERELLEVSADTLQRGANPTVVADYVSRYNPTITAEDSKYSLELAAAENQVETSLQENSHVAVNNTIDGETNYEDVAKNLYLGTALTRVESRVTEKMGFFKGVADFTESLFQTQYMQNHLMAAGLLRKAELVGSTEELSQMIRAEIGHAADTMSLKEYQEYVDHIEEVIVSNDNTFDALSLVEYIKGGGDTYTDISGYGEAFAHVTGLLGKGVKLFKKVGNVKRVSQAVKDAAKSGDTATVLQEGVMKTATKPVEDVSDISYAGKISNDLGAEIAEESRMLGQGIYSDKELDEISTQVKNSFKETALDVVDVSTQELEDGRIVSDIYLGNDSGHAMTKAGAHKLAKELNLPWDSWELVKKNGEGYYVGIKKEVYNPQLSPDVESWEAVPHHRVPRIIAGPLSSIKRTFFSVMGTSADANKRATIAERKYAGMLNDLSKTHQESYANLPKKERQAFDTVIEEGLQDKGKWFTDAELKSKGFNDKQLEAYHSYKKVCDLQWALEEANERKLMTRKGYKQYAYGDKQYVGKPLSIDANRNNNSIIASDIHGNVITDMSQYSDSTHYLVKLDRQSANGIKASVTHLVLPKEGTTEGNITRQLLMYRAGGRRYYAQGTNFIKIGSGIENPHTGHTVNGFVKTITTADNYKDAVRTAEEVNKVIDIAKTIDLSDEVALQKALDGLDNRFFKVNDVATFKELVRTADNPKGILDTRYRAEALTEGAPYKYADDVFEDITDVDESYADMLLNMQHYNRERGNILDSVNGDKARLMNFADVYDRTIQRAARVGAYGELMQWYGKELAKYSDYIENWNIIKSMSPMQQYSLAKINQHARLTASHEDIRKYRALSSLLGHGKRIMDARMPFDNAIEGFMGALASSIEGATPKMLRQTMTPAVQAVANGNPLKWAKGITYLTSMWGNLGSAVNNLMGVVQTTAMGSFKAASLCTAGYIPFRLSIATHDIPKVKAIFEKAAKTMLGMDDRQWAMLQHLTYKLGGNVLGGLQPGVTKEYGKTFAQGKQSLYNRIVNIGMMPVNEINGMNYLVANIIAILDNPGAKMEDIITKADALNLHMTRAHNSAFQAGKTIIPGTDMFAQWTSFPVRFFETIADKDLTKGQKTKLWLTSLALTGVGGTFLTQEQESNAYRSMIENNTIPQENAKLLLEGTLPYMLEDLGIHWNPGVRLFDQVEPWIGLAEAVITDKDSFDFLENIPASTSLNKAVGTIKAVVDLLMPRDKIFSFSEWAEHVAKDPDVMTGVKNVGRFVTAWNTGRYYNSKGAEVARDLDKMQSILILHGMKPLEQRETADIFTALNNDSEAVKAAIKDCKRSVEKTLFFNSAERPEDIEKFKEVDIYRAKVYNTHRQRLLDTYGEAAAKTFKKEYWKLLSEYFNSTVYAKKKGNEMYGGALSQMIQRIVKEQDK